MKLFAISPSLQRQRYLLLFATVLVLLTAAGVAYQYWPRSPEQKVQRLLSIYRGQQTGSLWTRYFGGDPSEAADEVAELGPRAVPALIEGLKSSDEYVQSGAAYFLGNYDDGRAIPPLIDCLETSSTYVQIQVINTLEALRDPRAVDPLLGLLDHPDAVVRVRAIDALRAFGDLRVRPELIAHLHDPHPKVRAAVVHTLGRLGDPQDEQRFIAILQGTEEPGVQARAAMALRFHDTPASVAALKMAYQHNHPWVSEHAFNALLVLGKAQELPKQEETLDPSTVPRSPDAQSN
jgi:HEAT repeat protein